MRVLMETTFDHIKEKALSIGFSDLGLTPVGPLLHEREALHAWLDKGYAGEMEYMQRTEDVRGDLEKFLPGAKTVLVGTVNYWNDEGRTKNENLEPHHPKDPSVSSRRFRRGGPPSLGREGKEWGKVARYAYGRDYHKVIRKMLEELRDALIRDFFPESTEDDYRLSLDAHPVMERAWARRAGLGFLGKNGCLITKGEGSWVLIGCLVTRNEFRESKVQSRKSKIDFTKLSCGNCTRCISKCPTGAIVADGVVDANLCISYLTIENRGAIPEALREAVGDHLFGCDICQEVCPFNARREHGIKNPFAAKPIAGDSLSIREILSIRNEEEFTARFAGSPIMRAKWKGMLRNACVVAGNSGDGSLVDDLENLLAWCEDAMVREHAHWAVGKLSEG